MAVGRREWRQESERLSTLIAETAANPNPIMVCIVSLFAPTTVTHDRILLTNRAPAQNDIRARLGPIGFEVALDGGK